MASNKHRPITALIETIDKFSIPGENGCIVWHRGKVDGYGVIKFNGVDHKAHREVYRHKVGEIPPGMHVLHSCDNRACVNKDHLFLGTNQDNIKDKVQKCRAGKKLRPSDVAEIKKLLLEGMIHKDIARYFGINSSGVSKIRNGLRWSQVVV